MTRPTLLYFIYDNDFLVTDGEFMQEVTKSLQEKKLIHFNSDSEILKFGINHLGNEKLCCCISPVNEKGKLCFPYWYSSKRVPTTKPENFHKRNQQVYLEAMARGEDLFPIFTPNCHYPEEEFLSRKQILPLEKLFKTYLDANPDPNVKLAVVSAVTTYILDTLKTFISVGLEFAELIEIKL